jgi:hypothetical protein
VSATVGAVGGGAVTTSVTAVVAVVERVVSVDVKVADSVCVPADNTAPVAGE